MKLFSILNKPANKAGNKQAGLVFLEYVIMAFIVTVAVICALWWFYWHLQQMTWEVKAKLDTLKTLNCELGKPGGPESVQPTPAGQYNYNFVADDYPVITDNIPYPNQKVTIHNDGSPGDTIYGVVYFVYDYWAVGAEGAREILSTSPLDGGQSISFEHNYSDYGEGLPYLVYFILDSPAHNVPYSVTVTQLP